MCGFVGQLGELNKKERLHLALNSILHRGPDNSDYFFSRDISLGLQDYQYRFEPNIKSTN